jgi:hypothetical protein
MAIAQAAARSGPVLALIRLGKRGLWREWRVAALRTHLMLGDIERLAKALAAVLRSRPAQGKRVLRSSKS